MTSHNDGPDLPDVAESDQDPSQVTPLDQDEPLVRDALYSYSAYLNAEPITPIPEGVWENIQTALSLEAAGHVTTVTDLADHRERRIARRSLGTKWVGGLVAASVTLLAVGIGANLLASDTSDNVVANAPLTANQSAGDPAADTGAAEAAPSGPQVIQAGFVPPAVTVMSSGTDYTPTNLRSVITKTLNTVGVTSPRDYFRIPLQKMANRATAGMLQSESTLRDCITAITQSETSQALIVDQATYMGKDAGIVVIPFAMVSGMDSVPMPANAERISMGEAILARNSDLGVLDIWVVGPECGTVAFDVYSHVTHSLN